MSEAQRAETSLKELLKLAKKLLDNIGGAQAPRAPPQMTPLDPEAQIHKCRG